MQEQLYSQTQKYEVQLKEQKRIQEDEFEIRLVEERNKVEHRMESDFSTQMMEYKNGIDR